MCRHLSLSGYPNDRAIYHNSVTSVTGSGCYHAIIGCSVHVVSWYGGWLWVVTRSFQMAMMIRGPHISFKTIVCSSYTCPFQQVGLKHLHNVYTSRGYPSDSLLPCRRQDMRREEFCATFKKKKTGSGQLCFWTHLQSWYSKHFPERLVSPFQIPYLYSQDHIPLQLHLRTSLSHADVFHGHSTFF